MRIYGAHFHYLEGELVDLDDESAERVRNGRQVGDLDGRQQCSPKVGKGAGDFAVEESIMRKIVSVCTLLLAASIVLSFSSSGSDATPQYYYVRLYPTGPLISAMLDEHEVEDFIRLEDSVVARLTLDQMTDVYNDVTLLQEEQGLLVSFESVPRQTYEMGVQPWEVGEPAEIEERAWAEIMAPGVVAIIVDQSIYNDIQSAISTYVSDVTSLYANVTLLVYQSSATTPESLRGFLHDIHQSQNIQGAILVGSLPYARWELPWGEECSLPLFYENLDDIFLDQDSDGLYDYHDWGSNEGVEIWVSWIRPPSQDPVSALQAYFGKTHDYYSGNYSMSKRGLLVITHDWGGAGDGMREALGELYGEDIDQLGGCEGCYAKLEPYLELYANNDYGVQNLWAHSSDTGHQFDADPGEPNWLSSTDLATLTRGPQFSVIWGCSVMNFTGGPGEIFATRYIMGTHNGLAALGVTRGIGTPAQELLIPMLPQSANLGDAVFQYLNLVTAEDYIYEQYPDELHTFMWDIALVGDPFLFFDTTPPSGQILTPVEGAFLNEDSVYIEAEASDNLGIDQVQFFAWYDDDWHYIDNDIDGSDGYQTTWDVSGLSDRSGIGLDALILDLVWNRWDATVGNLTLDRTPPTGSASIDGGATYAASTAVTLNLAGADTGAGVNRVMMSNNAGFSGATWVGYATSSDWTLAAGDGTKTVYVKFRDRAGNVSPVYSDAIILDTTAPTGNILIQGSAEVVSNTQIVLTLSASDTHGVTRMRLRNDTAAWSAWEPFATSRSWSLPAQPGEHTVWVQFQDPAGNVSVAYSDSIMYQSPHRVYLPLIVRNFDPSHPPTPIAQIAFVSDRDGDLEIYVMDVGGTGLTQLTHNQADDEGPSWSPDGSRIALHSNRDGHSQIYVMDADGSNETRLLTSAAWDAWVYWSPDGTKIAFSRWADHDGTGDYRTEVYVMNADGTNVRRLTYSSALGSGAGAWPSGWSPDGSQILFYWYREGYDQLWIMNSDGSSQRKLTTDAHWNAIPSMSPDGTRIAFVSHRDGNYEIYIMNSDGTNPTRLTYASEEDWRPTWPQDGSKILFESKRDGRTQVYWMNPDGSQQTRLTSNTAYDGQAVWRPSGH